MQSQRIFTHDAHRKTSLWSCVAAFYEREWSTGQKDLIHRAENADDLSNFGRASRATSSPSRSVPSIPYSQSPAVVSEFKMIRSLLFGSLLIKGIINFSTFNAHSVC